MKHPFFEHPKELNIDASDEQIVHISHFVEFFSFGFGYNSSDLCFLVTL